MTYDVYHGDCLDVMRTMADGSVDAVISDPPYGLSFMGREWDHGVPGIPFWAEALRVAKPGAHLVAFGGTRTYHRLTCAIEDAGWEVRDCLMWLYGSGFPKSLDVSKAIDKAAGAEREVVGPRLMPDGRPVSDVRGQTKTEGWDRPWRSDPDAVAMNMIQTAPATDAARQWSGWGTALKPAWEPIILARKPLSGTVAANVQAHGTGAINIDACRLSTDFAGDRTGEASAARRYASNGVVDIAAMPGPRGGSPSGRWPANLMLDESAARALDAQTGTLTSGKSSGFIGDVKGSVAMGCNRSMINPENIYGDRGGPSRFFYTSKASAEDREGGLYARDFDAKPQDPTRKADSPGGNNPRNNGAKLRMNHHPTVKPTDLMRWLCRLVAPPGGLILDPFMGSGSTGVAALLEGFRFVGIDREAEYVEIARHRLKDASRQPGLFDPPAVG